MAIAAPPTTPSRNRPTAFSAEMDAYLAWLSAAIPQINTIATGSTDAGTFNSVVVNNYITGAARRYLGGVVQSVGGTVNAITLTMGATATLLTGQHVRFVPLGANTVATTINLDGSGVKNCVTVTGAALPAGYIRAGMPCDAVYDGTNWVVSRAPEYANNVNGEYWRHADGLLVCTAQINSDAAAWTTADGSLFRSASSTWTYPAEFVAGSSPTKSSGVEISAMPAGANFVTASASSVVWYGWAATSAASGISKRVMMTATGRWY